MESQHISTKVKSSYLFTLIFSYVSYAHINKAIIKCLSKRGAQFLIENKGQFAYFFERMPRKESLTVTNNSGYYFKPGQKIRKVSIAQLNPETHEELIRTLLRLDTFKRLEISQNLFIQLSDIKEQAEKIKQKNISQSMEESKVIEDDNDTTLLNLDRLLHSLIFKAKGICLTDIGEKQQIDKAIQYNPIICNQVTVCYLSWLRLSQMYGTYNSKMKTQEKALEILTYFQNIEALVLPLINFEVLEQLCSLLNNMKLQRFRKLKMSLTARIPKAKTLLNEQNEVIFPIPITNVFNRITSLTLTTTQFADEHLLYELLKEMKQLGELKLESQSFNLQLINSWPNLKFFNLKAQSICADNDKLEQNLVKSLKTVIEKWTQSYQWIFLILRCSPQIQQLDISIQEILLLEIFDAIHACKQLKKLKLLFEYKQNDEKCIQDLDYVQLKEYENKSVTYFRIWFKMRGSLNFMSKFGSICLAFTKQLIVLKTLKMKGFRQEDVRYECFQEICDHISKTNSLYSLVFRLENSCDTDILLDTLKKNSSQLRELVLLDKDALFESQILLLKEFVRSNSTLLILKFRIRLPSFMKAFEPFLGAVQSHPKLRKLQLEFSYSNSYVIEEELSKVLENFEKAISLNCHKLTDLEIRFMSSEVFSDEITGPMIEKMVESFKQSLPNLQFLKIEGKVEHKRRTLIINEKRVPITTLRNFHIRNQ